MFDRILDVLRTCNKNDPNVIITVTLRGRRDNVKFVTQALHSDWNENIARILPAKLYYMCWILMISYP